MAIFMNPDAQIVFFAKVFGPNNTVTNHAKALVNAGAKFETGLYTVGAVIKGISSGVTLTVGSTSLMKHAADPIVAAQNKTKIAAWLSDLCAVHGLTEAATVAPAIPTKVVLTSLGSANKLLIIKALMTAMGTSVVSAKGAMESVAAGKDLNVGTFPSLEAANKAAQAIKDAGGIVELIAFSASTPVTAPISTAPTTVSAKPVDAVISLKDAAALGQKVHGTSEGSVYHCIAFTDHVKLAARIYKAGSVSIRAEWTDSPTKELAALEASGVNMKKSYGSIHFDAAGVSLSRIIGAFLMGTEINWKASVKSGADLIIGA